MQKLVTVTDGKNTYTKSRNTPGFTKWLYWCLDNGYFIVEDNRKGTEKG